LSTLTVKLTAWPPALGMNEDTLAVSVAPSSMSVWML
jgi:hypothetical protein